MDGLTLVYAYNISELVFKATFKIISICSFLKSSYDELFYKDIDSNVKNNLIYGCGKPFRITNIDNKWIIETCDYI